jgi:hypothetical protein
VNLNFIIMKKAHLLAFAGLCIFTSILGTSVVNSGNIYGNQKMNRSFIRDTVPQRDTPVNPKHDTTKRPYLMDLERK